jgi:hypothetical protein
MIAISMGVPAGIEAGPAPGGGHDVLAGLFASTFEQASGAVAASAGADGLSALKGKTPETSKDGARDAAQTTQAQTVVSLPGSSLGLSAKGIVPNAAGAADAPRGALLKTANRDSSTTHPEQTPVAQPGTGLQGDAAAAARSAQGGRTNAASGDDVAEASVSKPQAAAKPSAEGWNEPIDEEAAAKPAASLPANTPTATGGRVWTPLQTPKEGEKSSGKSRWQELGSDVAVAHQQNVTDPVANATNVVATAAMPGPFQATAPATATAAASPTPSGATVLSTSALGAAGGAEFGGGRSLWADATYSGTTKVSLAAGSAVGPAKRPPLASTAAARAGGSAEQPGATATEPTDGELAAVGGGSGSAAWPVRPTVASGGDGAAAKVSAVKPGKSVAAAGDGKGSKPAEEKRQVAGTTAVDAAPSAMATAAVHPVASLHATVRADGKMTDGGELAAGSGTTTGGSGFQSAGLDVAPVAGTTAHVASAHALNASNGGGGGGVISPGANASEVSAGGVAQPAGSGDAIYPGLGSRTIEATPTVLEIGVPGGSHGWLKIRAEVGEGGAVQASMSSATLGGQDALHRELPAMNAFLQSEHVPVSLQIGGVASGGSSTDGSGSGNGAGSTLDFSAGNGSSGAGGGAGFGQAGGARGGSSSADESVDASPAQAAWTEVGQYGGASGLGGGGWLNVMA